MITPSFSLTATERVLPRLALDFTTASLDSRVTFTRSLATATRTNASGFIEGVAADTPRFDFNPITLACNGLLIEESRINQCLQSQTLTAAGWNVTRSSVTVSSVLSPNNTTFGFKLTEDSSTNTHFVQRDPVVVSLLATVTTSIFAKAGERTWIFLLDAGAAKGCYFNLTNGTLGTQTSTGASITAVGNGWYRCTVTSAVAAAASQIRILLATDNGVVSYTGDNTSGAFLFGGQTEVGAFPTSYIPTTTSAVTRNADNAVMTGTNFSSWYNATEGALQTVSTTISTTQEASTGASLYLDGSNFMATYFGQANKPRLLVRNAGTFDVNTTASVAQSNPFDQVFAYKSGSISFASNATLIVNSVNKPIPTPNSLYIGYYPAVGAAGYANAWISRVAYWPQRLINNEVIAFSK